MAARVARVWTRCCGLCSWTRCCGLCSARRSVVVRARVARCRPRFSPDRSQAGCWVPAGFGLAVDRCGVAVPIRGPIRGPIGGPIQGPLEIGPTRPTHTRRSRCVSRRAACPGCMRYNRVKTSRRGAGRRRRPPAVRASLHPDLLCVVSIPGVPVTTICRHPRRAGTDEPNYRGG